MPKGSGCFDLRGRVLVPEGSWGLARSFLDVASRESNLAVCVGFSIFVRACQKLVPTGCRSCRSFGPCALGFVGPVAEM